MKRWLILAAAAPCAVFFSPSRLVACAVCLSGVSNDPVADAFNWSVLFLMAAPYTIVGSIAGWLFYAHRRSSSQKRRSAEKLDPILHLALTQRGSENE